MSKEKSNYLDKKKEDDVMSAVARNYVYEVKVKKADEKNEKVISKKMLAMCKDVANKYPKK